MRNGQQNSPKIIGNSQFFSVLRVDSSGIKDSERRENNVVTETAETAETIVITESTESTESDTEIVFNLAVTEVISASLDTAGPFSPVVLLEKVLC